MTRALMFQGTGSNVGKSMLVAGLCRAFANRGLAVRPFKPQNMSNNAAVTADGGEIGRAQALQARACRVESSVHMNPILLKPESEAGAQVVVQGRRLTTLRARDYASLKPELMAPVLQSFARIARDADLVLIEGAGSPAETNLRAGDIANMGFARAAEIPVILIGDIDRGGVIAQLVGTHHVIDAGDRAMVRGFLVNKFRGDVSLFADGEQAIIKHTGWPGLGTVPWFADAHCLPAEDGQDLRRQAERGPIRIAVPALSRIANFDDLDPLRLEPDIALEIVEPGRPIPRDSRLIILPGSKSTIGDLAFLRAQGWDIDIQAHRRQGGHVLGLCGGYQMLGRRISDPQGIEGPAGSVEGLGLLDIETTMTPEKTLARVSGRHLPTDLGLSGYEIHIGHTTGRDCERPWLEIEGRPEGAQSGDGLVLGCYVHGLFASDAFRQHFLAMLGAGQFADPFEVTLDTTLDRLADHVQSHVHVERLLQIAISNM